MRRIDSYPRIYDLLSPYMWSLADSSQVVGRTDKGMQIEATRINED